MEDMPDTIQRCLNNSSRSRFYVKGKLLGDGMPFVSSVRHIGSMKELRQRHWEWHSSYDCTKLDILARISASPDGKGLAKDLQELECLEKYQS
jgi:hypothetical protein